MVPPKKSKRETWLNDFRLIAIDALKEGLIKTFKMTINLIK